MQEGCAGIMSVVDKEFCSEIQNAEQLSDDIENIEQFHKELEELEGTIMIANAAGHRLRVDAKNAQMYTPGNRKDQEKQTYDALTRQKLDA